jgi:hypothetical protein
MSVLSPEYMDGLRNAVKQRVYDGLSDFSDPKFLQESRKMTQDYMPEYLLTHGWMCDECLKAVECKTLLPYMPADKLEGLLRLDNRSMATMLRAYWNGDIPLGNESKERFKLFEPDLPPVIDKPVELPVADVPPTPSEPTERNRLADKGWSVRELRERLRRPAGNVVIRGVGAGENSRGYLNYGGSVVINAFAGAGKSTAMGGMMVNFSQGLPFLGQDPIVPRNVVICQNENDEDDVAEMIDGAIRWSARVTGKPVAEVEDAVDKRLMIVRRCWSDHRPGERVDANNMGEVPKRIKAMLQGYRAAGFPVDVLVLDPLLGFWFNILDQAATQEWLVNHLSPVLRDERVVCYITHHIPLREVGAGKRTTAQATYAGYGGIIIPGWARATINLSPSPLDENVFEWSYEKRKRKLGQQVNKVWYLKQATDTAEDGRELVYWDECAPPAPPLSGAQLRKADKERAKLDASKQKEKESFDRLSRRVVNEMGDGVVKASELCEKDGHIQRVWGCKRVKAYWILDKMMEAGWLKPGEGGGYTKDNPDKSF